MAVWPSWPQACILPGTVDLYASPVSSSIGSASISARMPITLSEVPLRPWMTPTTPVRPMPVTTSSQPNSRSFSAAIPGRAIDVEQQFRMGMDVVPPFGDFVLQIGDAVNYRHFLSGSSGGIR